MAKNKTTETDNSVEDFLAAVKDAKKRTDCMAIVALITKQTKLSPKMWGSGIVGFGSYHYTYESGRQGDAPLIGLSPRANAITLYLSNPAEQEDLLAKLGKYKMSKGCVYIQKLEDIDQKILLQLVKHSIDHLKKKYPAAG